MASCPGYIRSPKADLSGQVIPEGIGVVAVQSADGQQILCLALQGATGVSAGNGMKIGVSIKPIEFSTWRRYLIRGKIYLMDNDLEVLRDRISKECNIL